jgi:phage-related protein
MANIETHIQESNMGPFIQLFELNDGTNIFRFTNGTDASGGFISFDGNDYTPLPCELRDVLVSTTQPTRPTLVFSQLNKFLFSALASGDIVGSTLKRTRTFLEDLATPSEILPVEVFIVSAVRSLNKVEAVLQLASATDINQNTLPRNRLYQSQFPGLRGLSSI